MASILDTIENAVKSGSDAVEKWFYRVGGEQRFYRVISSKPVTIEDATENAETTFYVVLSDYPQLESEKDKLIALYVDGWKFDCDECV